MQAVYNMSDYPKDYFLHNDVKAKINDKCDRSASLEFMGLWAKM